MLSVLVVATLALGLTACSVSLQLSPTPTATPPSDRTPALPHGGLWKEMPDIESLDWDQADLAAVTALPWIEDGISAEERQAARDVALLAAHHGDVYRTLVPNGWLDDGLDQTERDVLLALRDMAVANPGVAQQIAEMPFLHTLEPEDAATLAVIRNASDNPRLMAAIASPVHLSDGLDEAERFLISDFLPSDDADEVNAALLALHDTLIARPWVADGLDDVERALLRLLRPHWHDSAVSVRMLAFVESLRTEAWVIDGLTDAELSLVAQYVRFEDDYAVRGAVAALDMLVRQPWVVDGMSDGELQLAREIGSIRYPSGITAAIEVAVHLVTQPWVQDGLSPNELTVLREINWAQVNAVPSETVSKLETILEQPWVADGVGGKAERLFVTVFGQLRHEEARAAALEGFRTLSDEPLIQDYLSPIETELIEQAVAFKSSEAVEAAFDLIHAVLGDDWIQRSLRSYLHSDDDALIGHLMWPGDGVANTGPILLLAKPWIADGLSHPEWFLLTHYKLYWSPDDDQALEDIKSVLDEPWVADGMDGVARFLIERSSYIPGSRELAVMRSLLKEPWVADGLNGIERLLFSQSRSPWGWSLSDDKASAVIAVLLGEPWVQDGLDEVELALIWGLGPLNGEDSGAALSKAVKALLREPWVADGLDEDEHFAIRLLSASAIKETIPESVQAIETLLGEQWFQDGLDEDERSALGHLPHAFSDMRSIRNAIAQLRNP